MRLPKVFQPLLRFCCPQLCTVHTTCQGQQTQAEVLTCTACNSHTLGHPAQLCLQILLMHCFCWALLLGVGWACSAPSVGDRVLNTPTVLNSCCACRCRSRLQELLGAQGTAPAYSSCNSC
jgi:hypothetical protein